jgi:MarR family transcriptional regulator for hemolysin
VRSGPPTEVPIGLAVATAGRAVERAFDEELAAAGGSRPNWLILLAVVSGSGSTQGELAGRVGITGPTLVHHLDRLEAAGLLTRRVDPANRRVRSLALTAAGKRTFLRLRDAAAAFDARLRDGLSAADLTRLRTALATMQGNIAPAYQKASREEAP